MRIAIAVVHDGFFLDALLRYRQSDVDHPVRFRRRGQRGDLQGIERLARIAFDGEDKDANTAIKTLLAYGWGAPFQPIGGEDGGPIMTRNDDLVALVHEIAERRQLGK